MDVLILCKDCGEQFEHKQENEKLNNILELSYLSENVSLQFSKCMGICPTGKFCAIKLLSGRTNSMQKFTLLPDEIYKILRKE